MFVRCAAVAATLVAAGACSKASDAPPAALTSGSPTLPAARIADPRRLADDLPLLPPGVAMGARPVGVVRATYEFAARHPEVLEYVPCFCGCERGGHKGNHDCFIAARDAGGRVTAWDSHAIGCEVCLDVAADAMQMHNSGASVWAIRDAIEKKYAPLYEGHTPTPMPKRGGAN
jgi:hypothetical protein